MRGYFENYTLGLGRSFLAFREWLLLGAGACCFLPPPTLYVWCGGGLGLDPPREGWEDFHFGPKRSSTRQEVSHLCVLTWGSESIIPSTFVVGFVGVSMRSFLTTIFTNPNLFLVFANQVFLWKLVCVTCWAGKCMNAHFRMFEVQCWA